jgi:hypothetical protein
VHHSLYAGLPDLLVGIGGLDLHGCRGVGDY